MDTIYYTANFRTVKVAGGEDQVRVYLVPEGRPAPRKAAGQVVDLAVARARLERKNAWKTLVETAFGQ